jgi:hypothetical protein
MDKIFICLITFFLLQYPNFGNCMRLREDAQKQMDNTTQDCEQCTDKQKKEDGKEGVSKAKGPDNPDTKQKQGEEGGKDKNK